ncbi:uncharacterized protein LOC120795396 [Xiphias gladius]|uniref:uncharacterized protein LOC120795396 n=1 Tax=Xiphias gladius TaxID=8245 RepID=UPI001A9996FA|nr:uncharacterized protein LOC120795396 [Xiphias gladius]
MGPILVDHAVLRVSLLQLIHIRIEPLTVCVGMKLYIKKSCHALGIACCRGGGGGGCTDVRTPCKPPICTSWNICGTGTSHLKGVQRREQTQQRDLPCTELSSSGDEHTYGCSGPTEAKADGPGVKAPVRPLCEAAGERGLPGPVQTRGRLRSSDGGFRRFPWIVRAQPGRSSPPFSPPFRDEPRGRGAAGGASGKGALEGRVT